MKKYLAYAIITTLVVACSPASKNPIDYVNPFIGTGFHGHTYPGATTPFGAVQLSPDTRTGNWDACSGYHYSDSTIIGFSHTHLSGTGCADLADILFHPTTKEVKLVPEGYIFTPLAFSHVDENASPGYYSVDFKDDGIKAELTTSKYVGVHRYTFEKERVAQIIIDHSHLLENEVIDMASFKLTSNNELSGMRRTQGWVTNQYVYFVAQFSRDFESTQLINNGNEVALDSKTEGGNLQMILNFGKSDGAPIIAKVGISIVSEDNARENLLHDVKDFDFDAVHQSARKSWGEALSDIIVEGGTDAQLTNFYTAQYHSKVIPNIANDVNGQYRRHDMKIDNVVKGHTHYSTFSLWDTFRAWHPLMTLTNEKLVNDMVNSLIAMAEYSENKELPIWPLSAGETGTMIGYHAVSVIGDAYLKGIRGFDIEKAYEAMKHSSNINKKGSDYYVKNGFIPSNIKRESVSCLLEYAYDDWVIAQVAKELGKDIDYEEYTRRALSYINVFDGYTKFFRGKQLDGNWDQNFNPFEPGRAYTEATAWQYRFFAPHDVNGMIQLFGGEEEFANQLDSLFVVQSEIDGHLVDITGLKGQYAHGNEPSHHMAYLYNYVGQPWKTQFMTRTLLNEMYAPTPEGIIGNEDCGQMSAWYILSSLGLYAVAPGSNEFLITTPQFEKATIKLGNGKTLVIKADTPKHNFFIDNVTLNGEEVTNNYLTYQEIMEGGQLDFTLRPSPNRARGVSAESYPHSLTVGQVVSIPYTTKYLNLFEDKISIDLASATIDADIFYTLDGSLPNDLSIKYEGEFEVKETTTIRAIAYKEAYKESNVFEIKATKAVQKPAVKVSGLRQGTTFVYYEGYFQSVKDLLSAKVIARGEMAEPSIKDAKQEDHFGYVFTGYIEVPEDGVYGFATRSDDGSVLYVANEKVVDNDGSHAAIVSTGEIALKKGIHPYKLMYFEDYEGEHLSWQWRLPSTQKYEAIPVTNLFTK